MSQDHPPSNPLRGATDVDLIAAQRAEIERLNKIIDKRDAEIERLRAGLAVIAANPGWTDHHARAAGILRGAPDETPAAPAERDMTKLLCMEIDCDNFCEPRSTRCAKHQQ